MAPDLFLIIGLVTGTFCLGVVMKAIDQHKRDTTRKTYRLSFPQELEAERVTAFIQSISGTMRVTRYDALVSGQPSLVFEVWGTPAGIQHVLRVPFSYEPYVRPALEALVPGIRLTPVTEPQRRVWVHAAEAALTNSHRKLRIYDASDLSTTILKNFGSLGEAETLMMQWVIAPAAPEHKPILNTSPSLEMGHPLLGGGMADRDEIQERREKLEEPNMQAVLRVSSVAGTKVRAQFLVRGVMAALDSARGPANRFVRRIDPFGTIQERIDRAASPVFIFPVQLSAPELAAAVGWPLGSPVISGLPSPVSKRLPAPDTVPSQGRVLGVGNYSGRERTIAVSYADSLKHVHILGGTGVGKTTLMANVVKQDMEAGYGVVVIEAKGDLFRQALDYVPPNRADDVIVFDVNDTEHPVGFNILQQGDQAQVVDELSGIFNAMFRDHPSLWMQQVMYFGLRTLMLDPKATFIDLPALVSPAGDDLDWRDHLVRNATDPQLKYFWQTFDNKGKLQQEQRVDPLLTRIWPMSRSKLLHIIGQSQSSFFMDDVVRDGKILLVNLSGIEEGSANIMGTLLLNFLWSSVKRIGSPRGIYLHIDEMHHYMHLPVDIEQMLVEARSMGLGLVMAHQYLEQLPDNMAAAVENNAKTKVAFQLGPEDARKMAKAFAIGVAENDLQRLGQYETVARIATDNGVSAPFTMTTLPPARPHGLADRIIAQSRYLYGRPRERVIEEIYSKRQGSEYKRTMRPRPSAEGWGEVGGA